MPFVAYRDDGLIKAFVERGFVAQDCPRFILDVQKGKLVRLYTSSLAPDELRDVDLASLLQPVARQPPAPPPAPPNETMTRGPKPEKPIAPQLRPVDGEKPIAPQLRPLSSINVAPAGSPTKPGVDPASEREAEG